MPPPASNAASDISAVQGVRVDRGSINGCALLDQTASGCP
jgi:hypothetical protein